jgi:hypothetical protein
MRDEVVGFNCSGMKLSRYAESIVVSLISVLRLQMLDYCSFLSAGVLERPGRRFWRAKNRHAVIFVVFAMSFNGKMQICNALEEPRFRLFNYNGGSARNCLRSLASLQISVTLLLYTQRKHLILHSAISAQDLPAFPHLCLSSGGVV